MIRNACILYLTPNNVLSPRCYWVMVLLLFRISTGVAQSDAWNSGILVLNTNDTLQGDLRFEFANDLVQINIDNTLKTFSARQIRFFQIQDTDLQQERHFYALPYTISSNYKIPVLFEVLTEGSLTLLCREKIVTESVPQYDYYTNSRRYYTRVRIQYDYYFGFPDGKIKQYYGNKKDFFFLVRDKSEELKQFANDRRLNYSHRNDLIDIINFYNSLK